MPSEPIRSGFIRVIILGKIQLDDIIFQTAGVVDVDDVGVFLFEVLGVGFGKLTLADARYALQKYLAVLTQHKVKLRLLSGSVAEVTAWLRNLSAVNQVFDKRGKRTVLIESAFIGFTFDEVALHRKAEYGAKEIRFSSAVGKRITSGQLLFHAVGDGCIIHHQIVDLPNCHVAVVHHR